MFGLIVLVMVFLTAVLLAGFVATTITGRNQTNRRFEDVMNNPAMEPRINAGHDEMGKKPLSDLSQWILKTTRRSGELILPRDQWQSSYLRSRLVAAGFRQENAPAMFQGVRVMLAFFLPSSYLIGQWLLDVPFGQIFLISLVLSGVGFYAPALYLSSRIRKRQGRIAKALPNVLDMLVICVEAGLGLDAAVHRVGEEISSTSHELSEELRLTSLELRAGKSRTDAFKNLGNRTRVEEVKSLTALLIQTDRFGTSVADALRVHADGVRINRRQKLEEEAGKVAVKLIFPLIFFILPSTLVVVVGPAILQIMRAFGAIGR
mgnify:CR=1 FL=1